MISLKACLCLEKCLKRQTWISFIPVMQTIHATFSNHVQGMTEDNLDIYSLPTGWFHQADNLGLVISSLPFRIHFFLFSPSLQFVAHPLLVSLCTSHPLQKLMQDFSFFMRMLLLSCALHLLVERLNCCHYLPNSNSVSLSPSSALSYLSWTQAWNSFLDKTQEIVTKKHIYILPFFFSHSIHLFFLEIFCILFSAKCTLFQTWQIPPKSLSWYHT